MENVLINETIKRERLTLIRKYNGKYSHYRDNEPKQFVINNTMKWNFFH